MGSERGHRSTGGHGAVRWDVLVQRGEAGRLGFDLDTRAWIGRVSLARDTDDRPVPAVRLARDGRVGK